MTTAVTMTVTVLPMKMQKQCWNTFKRKDNRYHLFNSKYLQLWTKEYVLQVAETAKNQLLATTPMNVVLSWGVEKFIATVFKEMPALKFNVNGRLFKGFVVVAAQWQ